MNNPRTPRATRSASVEPTQLANTPLPKATPARKTVTKPLWTSSKAIIASTALPVPKTPATAARARSALGFASHHNITTSAMAGLGFLPNITLETHNSITTQRSVSGASTASAQSHTVQGAETAKPNVQRREPIKAYLRIRPDPKTAQSKGSYIQIPNSTQVIMVPPADHRLNPATASSIFGGPLLRSNTSSASESHGTIYNFTQVFSSPASAPRLSDSMKEDPNSQANFFKATTLPLIQDVFAGTNCLLFAYGPTGSGKTWTVQGSEGRENTVTGGEGILPRAMDVIWGSVKGHESKSMLRPAKLAGLEMTPPAQRTLSPEGTPGGTGSKRGTTPAPFRLSTGTNRKAGLLDDIFKKTSMANVIKIDENFEYSLFISYFEIYNEKIYDLLSSPLATPLQRPSTASASSTASSTAASVFAKAKAMVQGVKRTALSLKSDVKAGGAEKYVAGMKEVRVHSAEEAKSLLASGQSNRRVFSTLANRASSRSHSVFTIKVIQIPKGAASTAGLPTGVETGDVESSRVSRFSIVDLAGSERVERTGTTGDRLKEAGNINKSLMVLGQCMEVLRKNQDLDASRKPALVPFRHSKLTELFQSFFVGDGKAAMIVNVNPHETSFDENSHVMKFSAVAKEIMTVKNNIPARIIVPVAPASPVIPDLIPVPEILHRVVRMSIVDGGELQDIVYEEEDAEEDEAEEEDEFVNALLDELTDLRSALFEAEMKTIMVESSTKSKVIKEYEIKLLDLERFYQDRLVEEATEAELKLNAKLDILVRLHEAKMASTRAASSAEQMNPDKSYEDEEEGDESEDEDDDEGEDSEDDDDATEDEVSAAAVEKMLLSNHKLVPTPRSLFTAVENDVNESPSLYIAKNSQAAVSASLDPLSPSRAGSASKILDAELSGHSGVSPEALVASLESDDDSVEEEGDVSYNPSSNADGEEEQVNTDDDDYNEAPEPSPVRSKTITAAKKPSQRNKSKPSVKVDKKNASAENSFETVTKVVTKKASLGIGLRGKMTAEGKLVEQEKENRLVEELDLNKSLTMPTGSAMKPKKKRKLGGQKIKDVDALDAIADSFAPILPISLSSMSRSASVRSFKR